MNESNFIEASKALFSTQQSLPKTAIDIALEFQAMYKHKRMIASALIDDARLADWLLLAKKFHVLKPLCAVFFENLCLDNPVLTAISVALVHALLEQHNADALLAETWDLAADQQDEEALRKLQPQWVEFCQQ